MHNMRVVDAARGWIGTRFHHQGRLKKADNHKGGVDCLGLLVGIADELQLKTSDGTSLSSFDIKNYSHTPDTKLLKESLKKVMINIAPGEVLYPGDILLLNIDNSPQHLAIVSDGANGSLGVIHAYAPAKAVIEHVLDSWWIKKIEEVFRLKD